MPQGVILDKEDVFGGPARLVRASTGAQQPTLIEHVISPTGAKGLNPDWSDVGATEDGVKITVNKETVEHEVDESIFPIREDVVKGNVLLMANLAEANLTNLLLAWEALPVHTTAAGANNVAQQKLHIGTPTSLVERQLAFIVEKPDGYLRVYAIYKAALTGTDSEHAFKKGEKTLIPITWKARPDTDRGSSEEIGCVLDETT
jgi:hypothetical protein